MWNSGDSMNQTSSRKLEHLQLCAKKDVQAGNAGFDCVRLVHNAVPECNYGDISTETSFLNHTLASPLFIAGMTGGHPDTKPVNATLASVAEELKIAMGVGSQRAALENPLLEDSFSVVREKAPHAFIAGNIGAVQLVKHSLEWADKAVEMIDANAICIHLNFLQELVQPEGDNEAKGVLEAITTLAKEGRVPVIVKETGAGISREVAQKLYAAGVSAIDVGGFGGTSWAKVETLRAGDKMHQTLGNEFLEWGIPTAVSVFEVSQVKCGPVIATGGMKTGLDVAKAIALGADIGGMALSLLPAAMKGYETLLLKTQEILRGLKTAMFLTGAKNTAELSRVRYYLTGIVREMIRE